MKRVVVIGGGFAGLAALEILCKQSNRLEIVLIDKQSCFNFLPLLPDAIGRGLPSCLMTYPLDKFCSRHKIRFIRDSAETLAPSGKEVHLANTGNLEFDYSILCCGTETNFYGNSALESNAYKLDTAADAAKLKEALSIGCFDNYVVCGGGYTGVEIATNLRVFLQEKNINARIIIAEQSPSILGPLPAWMKSYVLNNLKKMDITIRTGVSVTEYKAKRLVFSNGNILGNSLLIWAAGVKAPAFIDRIPAQRTKQGRIKTDKFLRISNNCFAAGDNNCFSVKEGCLRMAVQFAIAQGRICAKNVLKSIAGDTLMEFKPADLGYIIPLANDHACGKVLGKDVKGTLPIFLHYMLCLYRTRGLKNRVLLGLLLSQHATR